MIPAEDEAVDDFRPGPYCEQCGTHESYELVSTETPPLNLYWVETDDHDEDWFVVASDAHEAEAIHEGVEGYGEGQADATFLALCRLSSKRTQAGLPSSYWRHAAAASFEGRPRASSSSPVAGSRKACSSTSSISSTMILSKRREGAAPTKPNAGR
jgi:hypothetical protein